MAFIARPVGAASVGCYGDRIGRKRTLISTLLLMGISTVLIGLLPGGIRTATARGRYAMFPQLGPAIAVALSSATFLVTSLTLGTADQSFLDYGWRVPFLISIVLVGAGLYVRLRIEETPVFRAAQWQQPTMHTPLREALSCCARCHCSAWCAPQPSPRRRSANCGRPSRAPQPFGDPRGAYTPG